MARRQTRQGHPRPGDSGSISRMERAQCAGWCGRGVMAGVWICGTRGRALACFPRARRLRNRH
jgi:hypothetical protein